MYKVCALSIGPLTKHAQIKIHATVKHVIFTKIFDKIQSRLKTMYISHLNPVIH